MYSGSDYTLWILDSMTAGLGFRILELKSRIPIPDLPIRLMEKFKMHFR